MYYSDDFYKLEAKRAKDIQLNDLIPFSDSTRIAYRVVKLESKSFNRVTLYLGYAAHDNEITVLGDWELPIVVPK